MEIIKTFFGFIEYLTWGWALTPILVVFGAFITIMSGFVQFEYFGRMFRVLSKKNQNADPNNISAREALLVSIGGRVGGGNIAGVAVAIMLGGPGAIFWMWCIALIGMATSFVECTLAQIYKRYHEEGIFRGGPASYIRHGLGRSYNWISIVYAVCLLAALGLGFTAFQSNTVAGAAQDSLGINRYVTGALLSMVTALVVFGGIKRVAKAADAVVPIMAVGYFALAVMVILLNITKIPHVFMEIVSSAFGYSEAFAGGIGMTVSQGLRRGLFSNEAGLGSAPNVAATALVRHPVSQGITQSFSVFIDTIIICTCTAFIILLGDVYVPGAESMDGIVLTQKSLASHYGNWSQYALTIAILLFAFSSIIYNVYLGENAITVISKSKFAVFSIRLFTIIIVFIGAVAPNATSIFFFSDPMMGILALINLIVIMMLFPIVMRVLNDFRSQLKSGIERPVFDPAKFQDLDIDHQAWNPNVWKK